MKKIRVLIVDDHQLVRIGLAESIVATDDLEAVGEAANGEQALEKYRLLRPDVVIMDYQMPRMNGAETTANLRQEFPTAAVIILSVYEGEEDIWRAAQAGASGYLPKSVEMPEILTAIRHVAAGDTYFPVNILAKLDERRSRADLTPREMEVLRLIVAGRSNKEIAATLHVSDGWVRLYVSRVLAQLQVTDRTQAAVQAIQRGLVHLPA